MVPEAAGTNARKAVGRRQKRPLLVERLESRLALSAVAIDGVVQPADIAGGWQSPLATTNPVLVSPIVVPDPILTPDPVALPSTDCAGSG